MDRLSPSSRTTSSQSWADVVDEVSDGDMSKSEALCKAGLLFSGPKDQPMTDLPSVGSAAHYNARCKPCAFFHTKGCQNDKECQFCHLCPPLEKQRRKRLREQMRAKLQQGTQEQIGAHPRMYGESQCIYTGFYQADFGFKQQRRGHVRQASGTSTISTQSNCSGWLSHSRQSSGSSRTPSAIDAAMVGIEEPVVPIALAQAVQTSHHQNMATCDSSQLMTSSYGVTAPMDSQAAMRLMTDYGASQLIPVSSEQIQSSNVVFVPIQVPMSMDMPPQTTFVDQSMPYACFPQRCADRSQEQWFYTVDDYGTQQMAATAPWIS